MHFCQEAFDIKYAWYRFIQVWWPQYTNIQGPPSCLIMWPKEHGVDILQVTPEIDTVDTPGTYYRWHGSWSTLVQVMAWCLNHCWQGSTYAKLFTCPTSKIIIFFKSAYEYQRKTLPKSTDPIGNLICLWPRGYWICRALWLIIKKIFDRMFQCIFAGRLSTSRDDSRPVPSQWETLLHSNPVSHWLGPNLELTLYIQYDFIQVLWPQYIISRVSPAILL